MNKARYVMFLGPTINGSNVRTKFNAFQTLYGSARMYVTGDVTEIHNRQLVPAYLKQLVPVLTFNSKSMIAQDGNDYMYLRFRDQGGSSLAGNVPVIVFEQQ